jgi:hypothetical protein
VKSENIGIKPVRLAQSAKLAWRTMNLLFADLTMAKMVLCVNIPIQSWK